MTTKKTMAKAIATVGLPVDDTLRDDPHYLGWALHSWNDQAGVRMGGLQ
jgi:hypothetical protein